MAWKKSSPELTERFNRALPHHPEAVSKKMFGYPACFVKGNLFVSLFEESVVIRLPEGRNALFPELNGAEGFNPMPNRRPMKDWWIVPADVSEDEDRLARFFDVTFAEVLTLPAKEPKPKAGKKPKPKRAS